MKDEFIKLTLVTNQQNTSLDAYLNFIRLCAKSGITSVQLREKNLCDKALCSFAKQLQSLLKPYAIPLIINDHINLAYRLNTDGVHLGQSDGCVLAARRKLGKHKIIGLTVGSIEQLYIANTLPIDYIGIGPIFPTSNKTNVTTIWGYEGLQKVARLSKHPIIAIGGIDDTNAANIMHMGAHGIAAIGAFHQACDPITTSQNLKNIIEENISYA